MEINHLAHEVINPLNIIVGCAELTIYELENSKLEKEKIKKYLDLIVTQSLECSNLLKNTLLCKNKKNNINIYNFIKNIILNYTNHPLLKQKNLKFKLDYDKLKDYNLCIKNECYLKIILNNLILNSIKYSLKNSNIYINIYTELLDKHQINILIQNKFNINDIELQNIFASTNKIGLDLVERLVHLLKGEWNIKQINDYFNVEVKIPKK